jgi:hypothetical protein
VYELAVVWTEPSINVAPAGRCSSTMRKSRSHSGCPWGTTRDAWISTRARPPRATWLTLFSNVVGETATPNPVGRILPSSSGSAGKYSRRSISAERLVNDWSGPNSRVNPVSVTA